MDDEVSKKGKGEVVDVRRSNGTGERQKGELKIRAYTEADCDRITEMFVAGMTDNAERATDEVTHPLVMRFLSMAPETFQNMGKVIHEENGGKMFLAVTETDEIAGMLGMSRSEKDVELERIELTRISVANSWRRKGVCRMLVEYAADLGRREFGAKRMVLYTMNSFNIAMRTYRGLGFSEKNSEPKWLEKGPGKPFVVEFSRDL